MMLNPLGILMTMSHPQLVQISSSFCSVQGDLFALIRSGLAEVSLYYFNIKPDL